MRHLTSILAIGFGVVLVVSHTLGGFGAAPVEMASLGVHSARSDDPRLKEAAAECASALAGKAHLEWSGPVIAILNGDNLGAMREAIVELQEAPVREAYNNFVQIPVCAALVVDLGIHPTRLEDCATGQRLTFNADNESASCRPTDYSAFDVPEGLLGIWTGTITQQRPPIPPYTLEVTILQSGIGSTIASGFYTGDNCKVHWTLLSADATHVLVNESVHSGTCYNDVKVTLTLDGDGRAIYDFENGNGHGILMHA